MTKLPRRASTKHHLGEFVGLGYYRHACGIEVDPDWKDYMHELWERSSVMDFCDWEPHPNSKGSGDRWHQYYWNQIKQDIHKGNLSFVEGIMLLEYLEILGT